MDYPPEFLQNMRALLGSEYPDFLCALDRPPEPALRLNPARPGAEAALREALAGTVPWEAYGRYARAGFRPGADPAHFAGAYYMQDASAMAPARALDVRPGEIVLDLCAAPGGKSGQIAAMLSGEGVLVSNEPESARAQALLGNLERLGAANAAVVCALPDQLARRWQDTFDAVLVDAPCSGEGMFRRDAQARAQWSPERSAGCAQRQKAILREAARMVAPGGRLVYSTCTFNRAENEDNVAWLLGERPDFHTDGFALPGIGQSQDGCLRLWPHEIRGEGHFVARLRREGSRSPQENAPRPPERDAAGALEALKAALPGTWPRRYAGWAFRLTGDTLWAEPPLLPCLDGLRALSRGLRLCEVRRGYVRPEHALAMALGPAELSRVQSLDDEQAARFLRGEPLKADAAGWTLVLWHGFALGWGKGADGALKNHLPKGLRLR